MLPGTPVTRSTTGTRHRRPGTQIQQLASAQLNAIGFNNIEHRPFQSGLFSALGRKGNDYDFAIVGWSADFPDPYDYVNKLLSGETIQDVQNNNTAYFNNPTANKLMRKAAGMKGQKRLTTYGNLDNKIMKHVGTDRWDRQPQRQGVLLLADRHEDDRSVAHLRNRPR